MKVLVRLLMYNLHYAVQIRHLQWAKRRKDQLTHQCLIFEAILHNLEYVLQILIKAISSFLYQYLRVKDHVIIRFGKYVS